MKGRDCLLLFLSLSALWLSLPSSSTLSIVQKWKIPFDSSTFRNSHFPEEYEKLPMPVVTDINEDGLNDIIFVTTEFDVNIASSYDIYQIGDEIADSSMVAFSNMKMFKQKESHLKLKVPELTATYSASLLPQFAISYGRRPVALAAGYIDPHIPGVPRRQVIVVLTELWVVMCFDSELNLLWESHAVADPNPSFFHKEASIMIDHTPLRNGDRGVVVVGGRKEMILEEKVSHEHFDKDEFRGTKDKLEKLKQEKLGASERKRVRKPLQVDEEMRTTDEEPTNSREEENHFSYYAFEGHTGELRWKHEPEDFQDLGDTRANLEQAIDLFAPQVSEELPDTALRLHLFHNLRHLGERDWTFFADDIFKLIPSTWRTREDTQIISAYFDRSRSFGNPEKADDDDYEENRIYHKRNVLVSYNTHGIEVLHLYSGRPLTRLELSPESLYLDLNYDGVIDKVEAVPNRPQRKNKKRKSKRENDKCLAIATSGVPTVDKIFEQNVCSSSGLSFALGFDSSRTSSDDIDMANPTYAYSGGGLYNSIFLVSSGKVTCINHNGDIVWQVNTDATWSKVDGSKKNGRSTRFGKVDSFLEMGGFPSIQPFTLYQHPNFVTAVGYHTLSVINTERGSLEAETRLSSVVNGPVLTADWDSDGDNDLIVPCINGFVGLRVTKGSGTPLYSIIFGVIIIALPILYFSGKSSPKKSVQRASFEESLGM